MSTIRLTRFHKLGMVLLVVWVVMAFVAMSPPKCSNVEELMEFQNRVKDAMAQLEEIKRQNMKLVGQLKKLGRTTKEMDDDLLLDPGPAPPEEYEQLRRRVYANTKELLYYIKGLGKQLSPASVDGEKLDAIIREAETRKRSLLLDQEKMAQLDGYEEWRRLEAANLSALVQARLRYLQHPADCRQAKKVLCNLNKGCGFGCQVHHLAYCLIFAYATERTLVLKSKGWRYNPRGWDHVFEPLSDTCNDTHNVEPRSWPASREEQVVSLLYIDSLMTKSRPKFLPLAVPKDLAPRILRFNGDPASWWLGQMVKYILRPRPEVARTMNRTVAKMNFKSPIVGVHIRRTDKVGTEAQFHSIKEYMSHVEDYFDKLDLRPDEPRATRRVYIASDDPAVIGQATKAYPNYEIIGDPDIAKTAATSRRYTPASLLGLLVDLHMLSRCDHLVCTFSSQVCRLAYEMMQANRPDASTSFASLDDIYYYGGQNAHHRVAVIPHDAPGDLTLQPGDLIQIAGNHWNGYGRGTNVRTNKEGLFPYYKTNDHLVLYPFPEYKQVGEKEKTDQRTIDKAV